MIKSTLIFIVLICSMIVNLCGQSGGLMVTQPEIAVLPQSIEGKDPLELLKTDPIIIAAEFAISQVLLERELVVIDVKNKMNNFETMRVQMAGLNMDPNALIASASGADVFFTYQINLIEGRTSKATINFLIFEVGTSNKIGTAIGISDEMSTNDISALCRMAVNNAMDRILNQVQVYWDKIPTQGKPVSLMLAFTNTKVSERMPNGKRVSRVLTRFLKNNVVRLSNSTSTDYTISYGSIYLDYKKYNILDEFKYDLEDLFLDELGMTVNVQNTGKLFRITDDM